MRTGRLEFLWLVVVMAGIIMISGCATTGLERRRSEVIACVKDLRDGDPTATMDAFEVCRTLWNLRRVDRKADLRRN